MEDSIISMGIMVSWGYWYKSFVYPYRRLFFAHYIFHSYNINVCSTSHIMLIFHSASTDLPRRVISVSS
jgi:hypothetical protein